MIEIIITTENKEQVDVILGVLEDAEGDGVLDFAFSVKTERVETNNDKPDPVIPEDLQQYADSVGVNILYQHYHKTLSGIWSKVNIKRMFPFDTEDENGKEGVKHVYEATIDFGCQNGVVNESYSKQGYFFKNVTTDLQTRELISSDWLFSYDHPQEDQS